MDPRLTQKENDANNAAGARLLVAVAYLLRETFEGSPEGLPSAYLDRGVGFFNTIDRINAGSASQEFFGTTVSAQTEHAKFYLDRICEFINGRTERVNWDDSWLIETVNDDEWDALRQSVRRSYENTLRCIAAVDEWNEERLGMVVGMVAHTAYHLGSIRQIAKKISV
ncbi:MAG: hypothetical protein ABI539_13730 [Acidobacteriota bacterium]